MDPSPSLDEIGVDPHTDRPDRSGRSGHVAP
jgi:hypothetical protein